jgi:hypothetical protein
MANKSFAVQQGKQPFNWNGFLAKATYEWANKHAYSMQIASDKAGRWVTCAVGNQCAVIPRLYPLTGGEPEDNQLRELGVMFDNQITNMLSYLASRIPNMYEETRISAIQTLYQIEMRSATIIQEILNQDPVDGAFAD